MLLNGRLGFEIIHVSTQRTTMHHSGLAERLTVCRVGELMSNVRHFGLRFQRTHHVSGSALKLLQRLGEVGSFMGEASRRHG